MEDLIPLLIVIAISIIGAANRKKKRQERQNISFPHQQARQDNELLHWLEKLGVEEEDISPVHDENPFSITAQNSVVKEMPVEVKAPVIETIPNKFSQYAGFISPEEREQIMAKEGISSLKPKKDNNDLTIKPIEESEEEMEKQRIAFNLRQAVVFSEILYRKYV
jgi:hypothetical protein